MNGKKKLIVLFAAIVVAFAGCCNDIQFDVYYSVCRRNR